MKNYYVYFITSSNNKALYIGVTSNLERRIFEHRNKIIPGFTAKYNIYKLVYYETYNQIDDALRREKQLKGWKRIKKNQLVEKENPEWFDLLSQE
jgi:putative endonuclease